jgi:hypothetical protein
LRLLCLLAAKGLASELFKPRSVPPPPAHL